MIRRLMLVAMSVGLIAPALGQELDCTDPVTQGEMNRCAYLEWQEADAELNQVYKQAMAMLRTWDVDLREGEPSAEAAMREAQRVWITFRDKACEAEGYAMRGGTAQPLSVNGCLVRLTRERAAHLRDLVESYGPLYSGE